MIIRTPVVVSQVANPATKILKPYRSVKFAFNKRQIKPKPKSDKPRYPAALGSFCVWMISTHQINMEMQVAPGKKLYQTRGTFGAIF
jgi:hypothetical protein